MKKAPAPTKPAKMNVIAFKPATKSGGNIRGLPSFVHGKNAGRSMVLRHGK